MTRAWRLVEPAQYRTMPWKNGGGTTTELAIHPADGGLAGARFIWRLSIASITQDGPFSEFVGYDRTILLIDGKGAILDFGRNGRAALTDLFAPHDFKGEWAAACRLVDGPCRDFNIMVDRSRGSARTRIVTLDAGAATVVASGMTTVLFALDGAVRAVAPPWMPNIGIGRHAMLRIDAAKDDDSPLPIELSGEARAHLVQIDLRWT